jgi:TonB family protein
MLAFLMAALMAVGVRTDTTVAAFDEAPVIRSQAPIAYPPAAKKEGVQGKVLLMLTIDLAGKVKAVEVTKGIRADLDEAAVASARKWVFTPAKRKGVPVEAMVALPVTFKLEGKKEDGKEGESAPRAVKTVSPVYPEGAKSRGVEGTVFVEATLNRAGSVVGVKVIKAVDPELDAAALAALRQWTFTPPEIPGEAEHMQVVIPVRFNLPDSKQK